MRGRRRLPRSSARKPPTTRLPHLGNYVFLLFFLSAFFIVYLWSSVSNFSSVFFWNGASFVVRQDFFKNYNAFSQNGEIYECGFSGVEEPLKKIEIQYLVLAIFFVIYELELLFFLPFFVSVESATFWQLLLILSIFLIVALSY